MLLPAYDLYMPATKGSAYVCVCYIYIYITIYVHINYVYIRDYLPKTLTHTHICIHMYKCEYEPYNVYINR